jgi:hypothetical protein
MDRKGSCFITPTTCPVWCIVPTRHSINLSATPYAFLTVITKNLSSPVYTNMYSALSSDNLPALLDMTWRSFFSTRRHPWFQAQWLCHILNSPGEWTIYTCVEEQLGAMLEALYLSTSKRNLHDVTWPMMPPYIRIDIRLKFQLRKQCEITLDTNVKAEVNRQLCSFTC